MTAINLIGTEWRGVGAGIELHVSFTFCFETEFKKDTVPFGIRYFGSRTWLIISTAFVIFLKTNMLYAYIPTV